MKCFQLLGEYHGIQATHSKPEKQTHLVSHRKTLVRAQITSYYKFSHGTVHFGEEKKKLQNNLAINHIKYLKIHGDVMVSAYILVSSLITTTVKNLSI